MKKRKHFVVTETHLKVMMLQSQGYMAPYIAKEVGKNVSTILNWQGNEVYKRVYREHTERALLEFDIYQQNRILDMFRLKLDKPDTPRKQKTQKKRDDKMQENKVEEVDIMRQMSKRGEV